MFNLSVKKCVTKQTELPRIKIKTPALFSLFLSTSELINSISVANVFAQNWRQMNGDDHTVMFRLFVFVASRAARCRLFDF